MEENKTAETLEQKEERIMNAFIEKVENPFTLDELGPGGNWKVRDGMQEQHLIIEDVKDFIWDLLAKVSEQEKELASLRSENEKLKAQLDTMIKIHSGI